LSFLVQEFPSSQFAVLALFTMVHPPRPSQVTEDWHWVGEEQL
jgi:hypothetical protein